MKTQIPEFQTKKELFKFLIENKDILIAQKKAELKKADAITCVYPITDKANVPIDINGKDELKVIVIINTTNIMDSHKDVHLPGIWTKSLQENKMIMHLQEHDMSFDKIISEGEDLKSYAKTYNWNELGFDFKGETQALVFESIVKRDRNPFMFGQYASGFVKNHSVGMHYVKLELAINDEDETKEFTTWNKYYSEIVNKDVADENGYFWAVKEAKVVEGSAVPLGSNYATPTLSTDVNQLAELEEQINYLRELINVINEPQEPDKSTQIESTHNSVDFLKSINEIL